jgi:hypothetical protein
MRQKVVSFLRRLLATALLVGLLITIGWYTVVVVSSAIIANDALTLIVITMAYTVAFYLFAMAVGMVRAVPVCTCWRRSFRAWLNAEDFAISSSCLEEDDDAELIELDPEDLEDD